MTLKYAVEAEAGSAKIWLDQDQRDKSEAGMMEGVDTAAYFVLFLSQCIFSRWFCKKEIRRALAAQKRLILVQESDTRHGAPRQLHPLPTVRCASQGCKHGASHGPPGGAWPSRCEAHAEEGAARVALDPARVSMEALNYALIYDNEGGAPLSVCDSEALGLAAEVLAAPVEARLKWYSELEFRNVSLARLLTAMGMRKPRRELGAGSRGAEEPDSIDWDSSARMSAHPGAAPADLPTEDQVLRITLRKLALGVAAPPLSGEAKYHVCIVHDAATAAPSATCRALKEALEGAFAGLRVYMAADKAADPRALADAAAASACVLPFLTLGLLAKGTPGAAAVASGLQHRRRFVAAYETDPARGGSPSVQEFIDQTAAEAFGLWDFTAFPWLGSEPEFTEICALRLVLDGVVTGS